MIYKHVCSECKIEFETTFKNSQFCGRTCANRARARKAIKLITYNCEICNKEMTTKTYRKTRFCKNCKPIYIGQQKTKNNPKIPNICEYCGKTFYTLKCHARKFCNKKCAGYYRIGKPSFHKIIPSSSNGIGAYRPDLDMYFRSRWEANYARYLKYLNKSFVYEPMRYKLTFPDGTECSYLPDFFIDNSYFVEIKGWMRKERQEKEKLELAIKQLPHPLFIIQESYYKKLEEEYSSKIDTWEFSGDNAPPKPKKYCPTCGKLITSIHRKTIFCSRQCSNIRYNKIHIEKSCPVCSKKLLLQPNASSRRKCCSIECASKYKSLFYGGKNHPMWGKPKSAETKARISQTKRNKSK